jgi:hypothetical protein
MLVRVWVSDVSRKRNGSVFNGDHYVVSERRKYVTSDGVIL